MAMNYAQICLALDSNIHIGSGRAGMLAKSHTFIPAHIVSNALVATIGKALGGQYSNFTDALQQVQQNTRCGPLFLVNPITEGKILFPTRDKQQIEQQFLVASNHVTLNTENCSSVDGALFEVEAIAKNVVRGQYQGQTTQLMGGLWFKQQKLCGRNLEDWLNNCLFGGELKSGLGRIHLKSFKTDVESYAGLGRVDAMGLHLNANDILPGVTLDGVHNVSFYPWVGRLFDRDKGFGRAISQAAFVAYDAPIKQSACFLPCSDTHAWGCWQVVS